MLRGFHRLVGPRRHFGDFQEQTTGKIKQDDGTRKQARRAALAVAPNFVALISTPELASCLAAYTSTVFTIFHSYALEWPVAYTERVENDDDDA